MLKSIYRKMVPNSLRSFMWHIYWDIRSLSAEYYPKVIFLQDYEQYWKSRKENNHLGISNVELIPLCANWINDGDRVFDFGCGEGYLIYELVKMHKIEAIGIDISNEAIELAQEKGIHAFAFQLKEKTDLQKFGHFNVTIATEVLEHIQDSEKILMALGLVSDILLVSIPNTGYLIYRLRLLAGRFPRQWHIHPAEHIRFWTLADFQTMVRTLGFKTVRVVGIGGGSLGRSCPSIFAPNLFFVLKPLKLKSD